MDPKGHAAIVTGGGSGLGEATATLLAEAGAKVSVVDLNLDNAQAVAKRIGGTAIQCDVSDAAAGEAAIAKAREANGPARILVNCAGIGVAKRILGREGPMGLADFERVIKVNLIGTFNMMRLFAADASKLDTVEGSERGAVVSVASVAAFDGQIGQAAYSASKGGIAALTLPAAREFGQFGIRVMTIAPGIFSTPMLRGLPEAAQQSLGQQVPFPQRLGEPAEFAALVVHCVRNSYLNGEVIRIDGAMRMAPK